MLTTRKEAKSLPSDTFLGLKKTIKIAFAAEALPRTPLEELTALPRPCNFIQLMCYFLFFFYNKTLNIHSNFSLQASLPIFMPWMDIIMGATRVQRQSLGDGLGSKPPDAGNEHVERVLIIMLMQTSFLFYAYRTRNLQRNLSAINVHQIGLHACSPIIDKAFSRHDEGVAHMAPC